LVIRAFRLDSEHCTDRESIERYITAFPGIIFVARRGWCWGWCTRPPAWQVCVAAASVTRFPAVVRKSVARIRAEVKRTTTFIGRIDAEIVAHIKSILVIEVVAFASVIDIAFFVQAAILVIVGFNDAIKAAARRIIRGGLLAIRDDKVALRSCAGVAATEEVAAAPKVLVDVELLGFRIHVKATSNSVVSVVLAWATASAQIVVVPTVAPNTRKAFQRRRVDARSIFLFPHHDRAIFDALGVVSPIRATVLAPGGSSGGPEVAPDAVGEGRVRAALVAVLNVIIRRHLVRA